MLLALIFFCGFLFSAPSAGPDFIVIGVAKGGTTSLYHYLNDHPLIQMPKKKEIHFFDDNYDKGLEEYLKNFPQKNEQGFPFSGDVTPRYLVRPFVPGRVFADFPDVKLIVLLRNPVDRAFSHYKQHLFPARKDTFEQSLSYEFAALSEGRHDVDLIILQRGFYAETLTCWLKSFPKEQLLILISEDFYKNPQEAMDKIYAFLGLPPHKHNEFPMFNKGKSRGFLLKQETREMLQEFYRPYNETLQRLLDELEFGITLHWD